MDPEVILGVLKSLPGPMALALAVIAVTFWKRGDPAASGRSPHAEWVIGVAIAAGVVLGYWRESLGGWPLPPRSSMHWIPIVAVVGVLGCAGVALAGEHPRMSRAIRRWLGMVIVLGISWKKIRGEWAWYESLGWIVCLGAGIAMTWAALDVLAGRRVRNRSLPGVDGASAPSPWGPALAATAWTGLSAQALAACDSLSLGTAGAILSVCCGSVLLASIVRPRVTIAGGSGVVAALMGVLLFSGYQYTDSFAMWMMVLLMLAPVVALAVHLTIPRRIGGWKRALAVTGGICVLPMIVLAVAIPAAIRAAESGYE